MKWESDSAGPKNRKKMLRDGESNPGLPRIKLDRRKSYPLDHLGLHITSHQRLIYISLKSLDKEEESQILHCPSNNLSIKLGSHSCSPSPRVHLHFD